MALPVVSLPTTSEDWETLLVFVSSKATFNPSPFFRNSLWVMAALVVSSALMSFACCLILIHRDPTIKWIARKDAKGYWRPNTTVTTPLMTGIHSLGEL